ncbi:ankyrin repeat-containing domain protein [Hypoxylon rubiginosum]|uniref:Ankyrin repeat-containing domain protein n=1 Tax=Hypoxylon rubiginosum TaxID=110542 RepID=A0ACC0CM04_9PEZI|nr:ankyrin repeat-containing domain protein [Hypoxylon rubiginosum]
MPPTPPKVRQISELGKITINGEEYLPTPHEVDPSEPEDKVWRTFPPNETYLSDPEWYDGLGQDPIVRRRIWAIPTEAGQIEQFRKLLTERPDRALDLMFAAAVKGKPYVLRFLLGKGVRATASEEAGDDLTLVPLHAAAAQGHLECVQILVEEAGLDVSTKDDLGGTPLMRACWCEHPDIARYLLERGADITARQSHFPGGDKGAQPSAFEWGCASGNVACCDLLLRHAKERDIEAAELCTPLACVTAADKPNADEFKALFEAAGCSWEVEAEDETERPSSVGTSSDEDDEDDEGDEDSQRSF